MRKPRPELRSPTLAILVDGSIKNINPNKINDKDYREALSRGIAEMIHQGKLRLADIE